MEQVLYTDNDFKDMMFPAHKLQNNQNPLKHFTLLSKFDSFNKRIPKINKTKLVRWILLLYDKMTPFNQITNLIKRKITVADYVGFDIEEPTDELKKLLSGEIKEVNKMITDFLIMHRSSKYALVKANEQLFYNELQKVLDGDKSTNINTYEKNLEKSILELSNGDNNLNLQNQILDNIFIERLELSPEAIGKRIHEGKKPIK